jgi:Ca-activated chloride channel family protein
MRQILPLLLLSAAAAAQGIVIERAGPESGPRHPAPVLLREHRISVEIRDQAAETEVLQVFFNPHPQDLEGIYLFPLPDGAAISRFTMTMGGKDVAGEILDAAKAREIYRSIVRRRLDPGLLEFAGRGCIRASLFPIPARGETRVTLRYAQALEQEGGLVTYAYPMKSDRFAPGPVLVAGRISIEASAGIATVFSPSHKLDVARRSEGTVIASFEESASNAERDFRLLFGLGRKEFGLSLASGKPAGEDGYFLLMLAPRADAKPEESLPKDIVFVLDTSGSMGERGGQKMKQAQAALGYALGRLDPRDRFNVISFSTEARPFRDGLIAASPENVKAAVEHVNGLTATGGTAIHDALLHALRYPPAEGRVPMVLFLTDGQPTIGPTDPAAILAAVEGWNAQKARLFVFGVGNDVNALLLTELAERTRGSGNFVSEEENIEVAVSALCDKISSPVLTDLRLEIAGDGQHDLHPRLLGDLFRGEQLTVVGRYAQPGPKAITLRGRIGVREVTYVYEASFADKPGRDYLARLWAVKQAAFLIDEIRRNGEKPELVDEIKRLGIRYGILTPYTSFLVAEERELLDRDRGVFAPPPHGPTTPGSAPGQRVRGGGDGGREMDEARESLREKKSAGGGAVAAAKSARRLEEAAASDAVTGIGMRTVDGRTFRFRNGVWYDTTLPEKYEAKQVKYMSEEYEKLLEDDALARLLSVDACVVVLHGGVVYEIVRE